MEKKVTKEQIKNFVKEQLATNNVWALRALEVVYGNQTKDEQIYEQTAHNNLIGFTGADAYILTNFYKFYKKYGKLSEKQMFVLHKKIKKYHKQVIKVADEQKLLNAYKINLRAKKLKNI